MNYLTENFKNCHKILNEIRKMMYEQNEDFNKEIENIFKKAKEKLWRLRIQ